MNIQLLARQQAIFNENPFSDWTGPPATASTLQTAVEETGEVCQATALDILAQVTIDRLWTATVARIALLRHLLFHSPGACTIDSVRPAVKVPWGVPPALFGGVPGPLVRAGIVRAVGKCPTRRPAGRGRHVTVWQLADAAAAAEYLRTAAASLMHLPVRGAAQ